MTTSNHGTIPTCWHCGEGDTRLIRYLTTSPETGTLYQCSVCGGILNPAEEVPTVTETAARQVVARFTTLSDDDLRDLRSDRGLIVGDCAVWLDPEKNRIVAWSNLADDPEDTNDEWFAIDLATGDEVSV